MNGMAGMETARLPRQARARRSRDRLFEAALDVFAAKGYDGARVEEIAALAGVNKQRLYAYFGSKGGLYREVLMAEYAAAARHEGLAALCERDLPDLTARIVACFFDVHAANPRFWRLLCWENLNGGKGLRAEDWERIRASYIARIGDLYRRGQETGVFRREVAFTTYLMTLFALSYFVYSNRVTMSHLLGLQLDSPAVRQRIEAEFVSVMGQGMAPPVGVEAAVPARWQA